MQYLISNTNMESVSSSKRQKNKKNISYRVYIYLTNVKGFFLFMCESCESKAFLFLFFLDFYSQHIVHFFWCEWMLDWTVWPSLFMWTVRVCESVCAGVLVGFTKTVRMETICELKCLEI